MIIPDTCPGTGTSSIHNFGLRLLLPPGRRGNAEEALQPARALRREPLFSFGLRAYGLESRGLDAALWALAERWPVLNSRFSVYKPLNPKPLDP